MKNMKKRIKGILGLLLLYVIFKYTTGALVFVYFLVVYGFLAWLFNQSMGGGYR